MYMPEQDQNTTVSTTTVIPALNAQFPGWLLTSLIRFAP
jgi:hypothetical protein